MSQHDFDITTADANTGVTFRAAVNAALQALASSSSGATAPTTAYPFQFFADSASDVLKMRNATNTAWIDVCVMSTGRPSYVPSGVSSTEIGYLDGVTSAIQTQIDSKQDELVSGDNIKTINNTSLLGGGNIETGSYTDADALTLLNASGSAPVYACRTWVNFNGTGTVAIRASGNVSSITDNGTGDYTVNFTTAMPDANYSVFATNVQFSSGNNSVLASVYGTAGGGASAQTSSSVRIQCANVSSLFDLAGLYVAIFR